MPMDNASSMPMDDVNNMQNNDGMNGNFGMDNEDPSMNGESPDMGMDSNMGMDNSMGNESPDMGMEDNNDGDDTMSLFNKLSDDDKEAARSYIQSMIDDGLGDDDMPENDDIPQIPSANESFIFTKKQLKHINEIFGVNDEEKKDKNLEPKQNKKKKNSPFNSPKFA